MSDTVAPEEGDIDITGDDMAETFALVARCWQYPTEDLVAALEESDLTSDVDGAELRVEYTRLFLGPGASQCPPYESVYRDGEDDDFGPVRGPSTHAVHRWYNEYGVRPDPDHSELPDHIATEMEFAAYLAATEDRAKLQQFLDEHPRQWLGDFADCVRECDPDQFYRTLLSQTLSAVEDHYDTQSGEQ